MMAAFDHVSQIPRKVLHQVVIGDFIAEGAIITTNSPALRVLGPPLEGANWLAADGSKGTNGVLELRTQELPLDKSVVVFGEGHGK